MNTTTTNEESGGINSSSIELLITMAGVICNLLLQGYTIYTQKNHQLICKNGCCDIEFTESE